MTGLIDKPKEAELARRLIKGDEEAFEQFVAHFRQKIFQYMWLMCGQREDAEEVAQETLFRVFTKLPQLENPEHVRPWVFQIARNECLMLRRKSVFAPTQELSLDELMPASKQSGGERKLEIADWSALPEDGVLRSELRGEIERAIQALPEIYKSVVLLRDVEELTSEETARILDLNIDVVKTRLHRGRLALRQTLEAYLRRPEAVGHTQ
ncbi:MAG TPA: sigma-70 family RNA polymerase sigma factor [Bryobacteraceae bacterium]|nr:sigma-70 family RNA polymerase sigma factor [Bryobacteraceae bacterium]